MADPAERVVISVYEGDVYDNPDSPENVKLAEIPWEFKPPRPQRDGGLEVTFEYGDDGILTVQIHDPYAGQKKRFAIQQTGEDQLDAGADHEDEADQRGPDQRRRGAGEHAGVPRRPRGAEEDRAGRDPARSRTPTTAASWRSCAARCARRWARATSKKMEEASAALNDRLLNYAYLL